VATILMMVALLGLGTSVANAATWESSDQWAEWQNQGYTLRNDIWGSGAGPQTIWANSYTDWGVRADHPNTGGVKAYPHVAKAINRPLSQIGSLTSQFGVRVPSAGAYNTAYDIWANNHAYEIMIWVNWFGPVGPIGSQQATANVGGSTWNVYRGSNGANEVFSFLRTGQASSGSIDVKQILNWIRDRGWYGDVTINDVQFGWEITSSAGGLDFTTTNYSVSGG